MARLSIMGMRGICLEWGTAVWGPREWSLRSSARVLSPGPKRPWGAGWLPWSILSELLLTGSTQKTVLEAAQLKTLLVLFKCFIFKKFYCGHLRIHLREESVTNHVCLLHSFRTCSPEPVSSPSYIFIIIFSPSSSNFSDFSSSSSFFFWSLLKEIPDTQNFYQ